MVTKASYSLVLLEYTACYSKAVYHDFSNNEGKKTKTEGNVNFDGHEGLMSLGVKNMRRTEF